MADAKQASGAGPSVRAPPARPTGSTLPAVALAAGGIGVRPIGRGEALGALLGFGGLVALRGGLQHLVHDQARVLADGLLDLGRQLRMLLQEGLGILPA